MGNIGTMGTQDRRGLTGNHRHPGNQGNHRIPEYAQRMEEPKESEEILREMLIRNGCGFHDLTTDQMWQYRACTIYTSTYIKQEQDSL